MQINRWLHLSSRLWGIFLPCDLFGKGIDQKRFYFYSNEQHNFISCSMVCKILFAPNSPMFQKSCEGEEDGKNWQMQSVLLFQEMQKPIEMLIYYLFRITAFMNASSQCFLIDSFFKLYFGYFSFVEMSHVTTKFKSCMNRKVA